MSGSKRESLADGHNHDAMPSNSPRMSQTRSSLEDDGKQEGISRRPKDGISQRRLGSSEQELYDRLNEFVQMKIKGELIAFLPLLPHKFGGAILLQYWIYYPGIDENFHILELNFSLTILTMAMVLIATVLEYFGLSDCCREEAGELGKKLPWYIAGVQGIFLMVLFLYVIVIETQANVVDISSPYYINVRIYTLTVSYTLQMVICFLFGLSLLFYFWSNTERYEVNLKSLRLAVLELYETPESFEKTIAFLLVIQYVYAPLDSSLVLTMGSLLQDVAFFVGCCSVTLETFASIGRISLLLSLRKGIFFLTSASTHSIIKMTNYLVEGTRLTLYLILLIWSVIMMVNLVTNLSIVTFTLSILASLECLLRIIYKDVAGMAKKSPRAPIKL